MSVIIILLLASVSVAFLFLIGFIWSVKTGQYSDEVSPSIRILFDDIPMSPTSEITKAESIPDIQIKSVEKI